MQNDAATRPAEYGFYDRLKAEFPSQILVDVAEWTMNGITITCGGFINGGSAVPTD